MEKKKKEKRKKERLFDDEFIDSIKYMLYHTNVGGQAANPPHPSWYKAASCPELSPERYNKRDGRKTMNDVVREFGAYAVKVEYCDNYILKTGDCEGYPLCSVENDEVFCLKDLFIDGYERGFNEGMKKKLTNN